MYRPQGHSLHESIIRASEAPTGGQAHKHPWRPRGIVSDSRAVPERRDAVVQHNADQHLRLTRSPAPRAKTGPSANWSCIQAGDLLLSVHVVPRSLVAFVSACTDARHSNTSVRCCTRQRDLTQHPRYEQQGNGISESVLMLACMRMLCGSSARQPLAR